MQIAEESDDQACELTRRVSLGWAAFGKIRDVFRADLQIFLKRKAFNQCDLPVLTYDITKPSAEKLGVTNGNIHVWIVFKRSTKEL